MTLEFQAEVLKFLAQTKEAKKYLPALESALFDLPESKFIFELIVGYWKDYKGSPALANMLEYFHKEAVKAKMDVKVRKHIEDQIRAVYRPMDCHLPQLRESLIEHVQFKMAKNMFTENFDKLGEGVHVFKEIRKSIQQILELEQRIGGKQSDPKDRFLFQSYSEDIFKQISQGLPTYLEKLNGMTAKGGFAAPELIIFMGAPKSFKTGFLLNVLMPYVRNGKKVFYADCENGENAMKVRCAQYMAEASIEEIRNDKALKELLRESFMRYGQRGGEMHIKKYQAYVSCVADIEADLDELQEEFAWTPDIIAIDYIDLLEPNNKKITEKRLKIQATYFDVKNMNDRRNTLTFSLSQVGKNAVDKKVINIKDFAEDFGKAANCDGAFAICQTPQERKVGIARVIPVVQRQGIQYTGSAKDTCHVKIEYAKQRVRELSIDDVLALLDAKTLFENPELAPEDESGSSLSDE